MSTEKEYHPIEQHLLEFLKGRNLYRTSILVAFSGGPDSTALLCATAAVAPRLGIRVYASWIDHGIRPAEERSEERSFVESLTSKLGVPRDITEAPTDESLTDRARRLGASVEAEARDFRYRGLQHAALRFGCERIMTAHTVDDQTETILFRVLSGAGTAGLRGIPEDRFPFLRPFMTLTKRDLVLYLESRGQDWRTDSTNEEGDYLRNRLRGDIIPRLKEILPGFQSALLTLSEKSGWDEALLSRLTAETLPARREEGAASFSADAFFAAPPALRLRALTAEAGRLLGEGKRVPYSLVRTAALAERGARKGTPPRRTLVEGAGLRFLVEAENVRIVARRAAAQADAPWGTSKESVLSGRGFAFLFEGTGICRIDPDSSCRVYFSGGTRGPVSGSFEFPLLVRSRRPGDRIAIPGGSKPIDDLLATLGVPPDLRDLVPVLEDRKGIIAILGSMVKGRDRYRHSNMTIEPSQPHLVVELRGFGCFSDNERSAEAHEPRR